MAIYTFGIPRLFEFEEFKIGKVSEFIKWIESKSEVSVDSETEYNQKKKGIASPYTEKMLLLQIGDFNDQWLFDPNTFDISFLKKYFEDKNLCKLFVNSFFDLRFLYHKGFAVQNVYDCFLAELSLTLGQDRPKGYRGLGQMCDRYCGVHLDKDIRGQIHYRGLDDTVLRYSANDVKYLSLIKEKQLIEVNKMNLENTIKLENRFILTLAKISYKGFKVDPVKVLKIAEENKVIALGLEQKLNDYVIGLGDPNFIDNQVDLFTGGNSCNINWDSPKQVVKLFKTLGINCQIRDKKTGKMKDSVDGKHLQRQKSKFEVLPIYLEYKETQKEITTYGEKFIKNNLCPITNRMHSEFFPILETGRISSSNPNLQNITATDGGEVSLLRECFITENGRSLIISDYSQQEPRLTAEYSNDAYLVNFILNGDGDSHNLTSTAISSFLLGEEVKVTKKNNPFVSQYNMKLRDIGKMINLGLDYGKTAYSVKDDLNCTEQEAQKLIDVLKSKTPEKQAYFKANGEFVKKNGYIRIDSVTNRISYFPEWGLYKELSKIPYDEKTKEQISKFYKSRGSMERGGANRTIQGSGGSMTKLAAIFFDDKVTELKLDAFIVNLIHDEIVVDSEDSIKEQVKQILEESMIKAFKYFCKTIPCKVDSFIGKNWGVKQ